MLSGKVKVSDFDIAYIVLLQNLQSALNNSADKARSSGEALLSLQDPSTDMAAVRSQMDALSNRVDMLKGKMTRFEEHYEEHMRKATEFQLAVERLLAKLEGRKEELLAVDIDTTDGQAVKNRIEELEVRLLSILMIFFILFDNVSDIAEIFFKRYDWVEKP